MYDIILLQLSQIKPPPHPHLHISGCIVKNLQDTETA